MFSFVVLLSSCAALSMAQYGQYEAPLPQAPPPRPMPVPIPRPIPRPVPQQPYPQPELPNQIPPQPIPQEPRYPEPQLPQVPPQPVLQTYTQPQILTQDPPMTIQPLPEVIPQQPEPVLPEPDCEEGNGFYVLGCSSIYWRCVDGRKYKTQCVSELKFNPETRSCQYTEEVPICNVGRDTNVENFVKAEEEVWTPEPESVKPPTPDCENGNGYYVFGCNTKYWRCDNGRLFDLECGNGLKFNPETRECQYKEEVALCSSGSESEMVKAEEEDIKTPEQVIVTVPEQPLPEITQPVPQPQPMSADAPRYNAY